MVRRIKLFLDGYGKSKPLTTRQLADAIGVTPKYIREFAGHPALAKYKTSRNGVANQWRMP